MAYMSRLGIWGKGTQFNTFPDFIKAVERRCVMSRQGRGDTELGGGVISH
jgi:hypothetical protein